MRACETWSCACPGIAWAAGGAAQSQPSNSPQEGLQASAHLTSIVHRAMQKHTRVSHGTAAGTARSTRACVATVQPACFAPSARTPPGCCLPVPGPPQSLIPLSCCAARGLQSALAEVLARLTHLERDKDVRAVTGVKASDLKELENYMLERLAYQASGAVRAQERLLRA